MALFKAGGSAAGRPKSQLSTIRGRISGPILVDDEFPMRTRGSGIAHAGSPIDLHSSLSNTPEDDEDDQQQAPGAQDDEVPGAVSQRPPTNRAAATPSPQRRTTNYRNTARYSTISHISANNPNHPQRKKSTFRSALSKLFGRKKRDFSGLESFAETEEQPAEQYRSELTSRRRDSPEQDEPKRSSSLPITEYERALRSHSVGPGDMLAIESARNSMLVEPIAQRRRAASSSQVVSPTQKEFDGVVGLSPRPASANGEMRIATNEELQDPDEIGRALSIYEPPQHRPRSKSLTGMPQLAEVQPTSRNRLDEIRYWRESYQPRALSPTDEDLNDSPSHVEIAPEITAETPRTIPQAFPLSPEELQFQTPADSPLALSQPFPYFTTMQEHLPDIEPSLQERVVALEAHAHKLEKLVSQLFELVSATPQFERAPQAAPLSPQVFGHSHTYGPHYGTSYSTTLRDNAPSSRQSDESFDEAYTYVGSNPAPAAPPRLSARGPSNIATVREVTSMPVLNRDSHGTLTSDHYTTLKALLDTERANRQILENQVTKLSYRLNRLSRTSQTMDARKRGLYSAFDEDDDDYEAPPTVTEDYNTEVFCTPHEEYNAPAHHALSGLPPPVPGAEYDDGSDKENQDAAHQKAPRTLSLGQLTLPKAIRVSVDSQQNF